jgi:benzylsuccinate CoA-transferase BbsE subunit
VVADLERAEGRELLRNLLERADILIHNVAPPERAVRGLDSVALCAAHPTLVVTSISMFGDSGPYANYRGYELNASHASGWAFLSPGASPYPNLPPLKCFGHHLEFQDGAHAAMVTLAAYLHRLKSGTGQAVEVSEQECVAAMLEQNFVHYTFAGLQASRLGQRIIGPWFIADCADGKIFVFTVEEDQWQRLVEFMGNPEWANEDLFKDCFARGQNNDALKALMAEWIGKWRVLELYKEAQQRRIPFATINTMNQLYNSEHLRERKFFVPLEQPGVGTLMLPGTPPKYGKIPWSLRRPAPRLAEPDDEVVGGDPWPGEAGDSRADKTRRFPSSDANSPLSGVRVLDFTWVWAGPYCDPSRDLSAFALPAWLDHFRTNNRGSISMSAFGQTEPFRGFIGYGPPAAALSGLFFATGYPGGEPCEIGVSYPDPNAGVFGALAVMAALNHRALTGEGQYIDQSQWETVLAEMPEGLLKFAMTGREPERSANHDSIKSPHECYKAAGDSEK